MKFHTLANTIYWANQSVALFAAQRFFVAAMIAALPAALSFRFGLAAASGST